MMADEKMVYLRHEMKYPIDLLQYQVLQRKLRLLLKPDSHAEPKTHQYSIRNIYFDDLKETALFEKEAGVYQRKKYRIRIYNHSDSLIKFERKSKVNQFILKESCRITRKEAEQIIAGSYDFLAKSLQSLLKEFYLENRCNLMRPVVIVEYEREAYVHPYGNVRVTFDTNLRTEVGAANFFDQNLCTTKIVDQPSVLMEIKYDEFIPSFICGLFPDSIVPRMAFGKFVVCRTQQKNQTGNPSCTHPNKYT